MKKTVQLAAFAVSTLVAASGVAWAANVQCEVGAEDCVGKNQADTITGTGQGDAIFARGGPDTVLAKDGNDIVEGGKGPDTVNGGLGNDDQLWGGTENPLFNYPDESDDEVYGGPGRDFLRGGFGQGGQDKLYGGKGDDTLIADQSEDSEGPWVVTKEILDCGPGRDTAYFDRGLDVVRDNCEFRSGT